jgi:CRISPR-associated exonuclease Cas4
MQYLALLLLLIALLLFWKSANQRKSSGLPGGRIIYTDTSNWGKVEKALYDPDLGLTGKPDYLVDQGGKIIPVEVKSGRTPESPYDSHIFQLAAYCLLVDRTYGQRPPYGIIHYSDRDFAVDYTYELESALLDLLTDMQHSKQRREVPRSHSENQRCNKCGFRAACDQVLR